MAWVIGIGFIILAMVWFAMEVATYEDKGKGFRSFFKTFKTSFIFIVALFVIGGVIYYGFIH
ncbi:hypothetical protein JCM9140_2726 [Halalkalibacter wakoensis JCM 9140]|uniref:Uncharacterized protein n=1 Tax=Halalkalibacter wakoensis JCM 9140 TaxID=1236970 RepID=W4Q3T5_9BACI|nr:hypothetical protein [Halalkalibacter wakoensis]GAE26642.1 hypothetical protein JCM9140_2726 [Halalkalibacter wakoensis JCM 9140]